MRNQHPAQLTVLHLDPRATAPVPAGTVQARADAAYTSLFLGGTGNGNTFGMDGEILRTGLKAEVGLGAGLSLAAELPLLHTNGGFLDAFLIDWHDLFGLPDQDRSTSPRNQFEVRATRQLNTVYELRERDLEVGDIPMALTWSILSPEPRGPDDERRNGVGLAARVGVEWPTGDADAGFGNGEVDWSLGLLGELRTGPVAWTAHASHTFAGTPDVARRGGLDFADVTSAGLGLEWAVADRWALLVQTELETSTLRNLDFDRVSDPQWLLWTGVRTRVSRSVAIEVALGEDLSAFVAPDFTAYLGLTVQL